MSASSERQKRVARSAGSTCPCSSCFNGAAIRTVLGGGEPLSEAPVQPAHQRQEGASSQLRVR